MAPVDFLEREENLVKLLCYGAAWPALLAVGICVLLWRLAGRLVVDARALVPKRKAAPEIATPKRVTVEMLSAESEPQYQPGRWMDG